MNKKLQKIINKILTYVIVVILIIYIAFPLAWAIISSFLSEIELTRFSGELKLPTHLTLSNYQKVLYGPRSDEVVPAMLNSATLALTTTFYSVSIGLLASYGFVRFKFRGKEFLFSLILFFQVLPGLLFLIPIYVMLRTWGLYDTLFGLFIVLAAGFETPFITWLLSSYMGSIPVEVEEAAKIDGANSLQILYRIFLPLLTPALLTAALYCFISAWNEFFLPLIAASYNARTLPLIIAMHRTEFYPEFATSMAITTLCLIPPTLIVILLNRYFIKGLLAGALKQ